MAIVIKIPGSWTLVIFVFLNRLSSVYCSVQLGEEVAQFIKYRDRDPTEVSHYLIQKESEGIQVDARCEFCKYFVQGIDNELESAKILGAIELAIFEECNKTLPQSLCIDVTKYAGELIKAFIKSEANPKKICLQIGLCANDTVYRYVEAKQIGRYSLDRFPILCRICEKVAEYVNSKVKNFMDTLGNSLIMFCHRLAPPTDQECVRSLMNRFEDFEKTLIDKWLKPASVCTTIIDVC